ncbi:glycosyltransferase family 39 protein [Belliella sp. DSM 111904]|uniref:Glycosyltransferase family 39 protein n=1 Tax=Belliella filtrata TaxID=2923435 RepID=A0ABS9V1G8_9BACT|nr:glycosyltransferase family 39 protein [Belliella filtrata]MCH7410226.1 glycosyltransferase family 39 protein [Belliella filtrata]
MKASSHSLQNPIYNALPIWTGVIFLVSVWYLGYDGITFSDDVYYLLKGKEFWNGENVLSDHHFSSRLGSYIFSGFFTYLFYFDDHIGSIASLLSYIFGLLLITRLIKTPEDQLWTVAFFSTQVFFMHFIHKNYPDSILVAWISMILFSSYIRHQKPVIAAFLMSFAFFGAMLTKETIVYLFPFPLALYFLEKKTKDRHKFYLWLLIFATITIVIYLGFYWFKFGNALYRIQTIQDGHYISEYSFADKDWKVMLWRVTFWPFVSFVERGYWLWIVLAIPAIISGVRHKTKISFEFGIAAICLFAGFWWMSTSLQFYNPIHLNPRHLIILIPVLAPLIGNGSGKWLHDSKTRIWVSIAILLGAVIALTVGDWKQMAFLGFFSSLLLFKPFIRRELLKVTSILMLVAPVVLSIGYQKKLKNYTHFVSKLHDQVETNELVMVNNFVDFSKEVLLPNQTQNQAKLSPIEDLKGFESLSPDTFTLIIYNYYIHAYPKEIPDVELFFKLCESLDYEITFEVEDDWLRIVRFEKRRKG